jgi:hypothetical protein
MSSDDGMTIDEIESAWLDGGSEDARRRHDDAGRADFEHRAATHILRSLGGMDLAASYATQAGELTGRPTISFALLNNDRGGCPIRFGAARLYYIRENLTLEVLFKRPDRSVIYRAFREWAEEDTTDDDRHRGMIFRLPGCPGHGNRAILHTYPVPFEGKMTRVSFGATEEGRIVLYTLEPLDQLLAALAHRRRNDE